MLLDYLFSTKLTFFMFQYIGIWFLLNILVGLISVFFSFFNWRKNELAKKVLILGVFIIILPIVFLFLIGVSLH